MPICFGQESDSLPEAFRLTIELYDDYFDTVSADDLHTFIDLFDKLEMPYFYENIIESYMGLELIDFPIDTTDLSNFREYINFKEEPFSEDLNYDKLVNNEINNFRTLIEDNNIRKKLIAPNISKRTLESTRGSHDYLVTQLNSCGIEIPNDEETFLSARYILPKKALFCPIEWDSIQIIWDSIQIKSAQIISEDKNFESKRSMVYRSGFSYGNTTSIIASGSIPTPISLTGRIVDGTAQFLVDRVKEELLVTFFENMLHQLNSTPELQSLFPTTLLLLSSEDFITAPNLGKLWMNAFETDLKNFQSNLEYMLVMDPDYYDLAQSSPVQIFNFAHKFLKNLHSEDKFISLIDLPVSGKLKKQLNLLSHVIENLQYKGQQKFIDQKTFELLFNRENYEEQKARRYFTALLYQQNKGAFKELGLDSLIKIHYETFSHSITDFYRLFHYYNQRISFYNDLTLNSTNNTLNENFQSTQVLNALDQATRAFNNFINFAIELSYFYSREAYKKSNYNKYYKDLLPNTLQFIRATENRNYAQSLFYGLQVLKPIIEARLEKLDPQSEEAKTLKKVPELISFYGGMMVDFLYAQNASDIRHLLHKYAAPVGSYRTKRINKFAVGLSAYPGIYTGLETLNLNDKIDGVSGITAPIGISMDWGNRMLFWNKENHSTSLFFPLVDIGSAFSYRWGGGSSEGFPDDLQFRQIISPGMYITWGLPKVPISVMTGFQYTPNLRQISEGTAVLESNAIRFGLNMTMDIPIIFLHKKRSD